MTVHALGLDVGTRTGWCLPEEGGTYRTWETDYTPKPATKKRAAEPEGLRYFRFFEDLSGLVRNTTVRVFVIEQPFSKSRRASEVLSGFITAAELVAHIYGVDYLFCAASTLKSFGRKSGVEPDFEDVVQDDRGVRRVPRLKEPMRRRAETLLGRPVTDNEADAYWLVQWYHSKTKGVEPRVAQSSLL